MKPEEKINKAQKVLPLLEKMVDGCYLCAKQCGADRIGGQKGSCGASGVSVDVYSYMAHHGEEPPISGREGSGTVFFSHCSMKCVYCQNFRFSQDGEGVGVKETDLARIFLDLQGRGCNNINLVSPTQYVPMILRALMKAWAAGLHLPIIYNTGGYDSIDTIRALDGLIDVYLPDMRYSKDPMSTAYSASPGYVRNNRLIVREMYRQVGDLVVRSGTAAKGVIVRLLVLPGGISGTVDTLEYIAKEIGTDITLSVMSQYYPAYKASGIKTLKRRTTREEYAEVTRKLEELGFSRGWVQPYSDDLDVRYAGESFEMNVRKR